MNDLSRITAVCVDTLNHELAVDACWKMSQHGFAEVVLFTDEAAAPHLPQSPFDGFRVQRIATLEGVEGYSQYVLHELADHITTTHALVFQWDGFVLDAAQWSSEFLEYDYIGAIWPRQLVPANSDRRVGNGGFSLRSAALMRAAANMASDQTLPEDVVICHALAQRLEQEHGFRFAPETLARHFSTEFLSLPQYRNLEPQLACDATFGFHGFFNFHLAFDDFALIDLIDNRLGPSRDAVLSSWNTAALIVNLAIVGRQAAAAEISLRCAPLLGIDPAQVRLEDIVMRHTP